MKLEQGGVSGIKERVDRTAMAHILSQPGVGGSHVDGLCPRGIVGESQKPELQRFT